MAFEFVNTIITLDETKDYLRIEQDYTDEDENILKPLIVAAEGYLEGAVGTAVFDAIPLKPRDHARGKVYCLALVQEWYDNRGNTGVSKGLKTTLDVLGAQLKYGVVLPIE